MKNLKVIIDHVLPPRIKGEKQGVSLFISKDATFEDVKKIWPKIKKIQETGDL